MKIQKYLGVYEQYRERRDYGSGPYVAKSVSGSSSISGGLTAANCAAMPREGKMKPQVVSFHKGNGGHSAIFRNNSFNTLRLIDRLLQLQPAVHRYRWNICDAPPVHILQSRTCYF